MTSSQLKIDGSIHMAWSGSYTIVTLVPKVIFPFDYFFLFFVRILLACFVMFFSFFLLPFGGKEAFRLIYGDFYLRYIQIHSLSRKFWQLGTTELIFKSTRVLGRSPPDGTFSGLLVKLRAPTIKNFFCSNYPTPSKEKRQNLAKK